MQKAFEATYKHRETENTGNFYVGDLSWEDVTESTSELLDLVLNEQQMREEITEEMEMTML